MKENLSKKIIEKIKEEHIQPKPKWQFSLKAYLVWLLSALSLFIGSLAFSVVLYLIINNDWDVYVHITDNLIKFTILSLPYLWIVLLLLFVIISYYNFKHTKKGYKYHFYIILLSSILLSIIFGSLLYSIGVGRALDNILAVKMPMYEKLIFDRKGRWTQPDKGLLAGRVEPQEEKTYIEYFKLIDLSGNIWQVRISTSTKYKKIESIKGGIHIRMVGENIDDNVFKANLILPVGPPNARWLKLKQINYYPPKSPCMNMNNCHP